MRYFVCVCVTLTHAANGVIMGNTLWVNRRPFQQHARAGNGVILLDHSCKPDWLTLPDAPEIPADLRGRSLRVKHVARINLCPCGFKHGDKFSEHMAQYHLLEGAGRLAVVGCSENNEWITVNLSTHHATCIEQLSIANGDSE